MVDLGAKKLWIAQQCRNQMGRYQYYHNAKEHAKTYELFALGRDDCWIENFDLGFFEGTESVKKFFVDFHYAMDGNDIRGSFCMHTLTTEVIEVADDLKTAKAVWVSPGCETRRVPGAGESKLHAYWVWVRYAVDFIEDGGEWKFWHFTIFSDITCAYDTPWVDMEYHTLGTPDMLQPTGPCCIHLEYEPTLKPQLWPVPPAPYSSYDGNTMTPRKVLARP